MRHAISLAAVALAAMSLTACVSGYGYGPGPRGNSIEGTWLDPNGIQSSFSGGTFQTRTTDTNTLLATGRYTEVRPGLVRIDLRSLVRNTNSTVNCALATPTTLNCTSSSGDQFQLTRRLV